MNNDESAFMMLEALIAVLILGTVGLSLLMVMQSSQEGTLKISDKTCAQWVADNQLSRWLIAPPSSNIVSERGKELMCHDEWVWSINAKKNNDPRFESLKISVYRGKKKETELNALISQR